MSQTKAGVDYGDTSLLNCLGTHGTLFLAPLPCPCQSRAVWDGCPSPWYRLHSMNSAMHANLNRHALCPLGRVHYAVVLPHTPAARCAHPCNRIPAKYATRYLLAALDGSGLACGSGMCSHLTVQFMWGALALRLCPYACRGRRGWQEARQGRRGRGGSLQGRGGQHRGHVQEGGGKQVSRERDEGARLCRGSKAALKLVYRVVQKISKSWVRIAAMRNLRLPCAAACETRFAALGNNAHAHPKARILRYFAPRPGLPSAPLRAASPRRLTLRAMTCWSPSWGRSCRGEGEGRGQHPPH